MICGIGARNNYAAVMFLSNLDHPEGGFPHISKTHLGEIVESIIIDHKEVGLVFLD
jgi:hypothetical protein